ncbi:Peptidoglycan glycosyltransferase MrdB [Desulfovibrionales bacterium]
MSFDRRLFTMVNWPLIGLTLTLFGIGVLNLYSASGYRMEEGVSLNPFYKKQLLWGLLSLPGLCLFLIVDYRRFSTMAWPAFVITVLLLAVVPFVGQTAMGARRWINVGFFSFQPSEVAKISVLLLGSLLLSRNQGRLGFQELALVLGVFLIPAVMVVMQPDLGSGLNILLILGGLILYRGLTTKVFRSLLVGIPALLPLVWTYLHDYQKRRILTFMDPTVDPRGAGYHIIQSQIAIGSGQIWGKGFMAGTQSQLRFLPEKHTDFAVAVFGEEWGFVGCLILVGLFCLFLLSIFTTVRDARDRFGSFLAAGVLFHFFWQICINMGMVLGLMPVVGISLPFISYGGSAMIVNGCLIGLVLNISMRRGSFICERGGNPVGRTMMLWAIGQKLGWRFAARTIPGRLGVGRNDHSETTGTN